MLHLISCSHLQIQIQLLTNSTEHLTLSEFKHCSSAFQPVPTLEFNERSSHALHLITASNLYLCLTMPSANNYQKVDQIHRANNPS